MTAVTDRPPTARGETGIAEPSRRPQSRPRASAVLVVLITAVCAGIAAYLARVSIDRPASLYAVPSASTSWVQTPAPSTVGWFRATQALPGRPESAALWIDARDTYRLWINGSMVATNRAQARAGARPVAGALDVASALKPGANVIAIQVVGLGEQTAAVWMRLHALFANGRSVELGTGSPAWRATSEAGLTGSSLGDPPRFIGPDQPTRGWVRPRVIAPLRPVTAAIPSYVIDEVEDPATFNVVSEPGSDVVYRVAIALRSQRVDDSWLRVAASGALVLTANREMAATRPAPPYTSPNSRRPVPLWLVHLGTRLHAGSNVLTFHVSAARATAVASDLFVRVGGTWLRVPRAQQHWSVETAGRSSATPLADPAVATAIWPNGYIATAVPDDGQPSHWNAFGIGALAGLVLSGLIVALTRLRLVGRRGARPAADYIVLGRLLLALAPPAGVIAAALAVGRWNTLRPSWAYGRSAVVVVVIAALVVPVSAALAGVLPARPRRGSWTRLVGRVRAAHLTSSRVAVIALAVISTTVQGWRLGRQPVWQDEATSIAVAHAIRDHGLPRLDSGLYYFKGELYHALLAGVTVFTDSTTALRAVSLVWFAGTVLAFGLLLMPILTARPSIVVLATALLVSVPAEMAWARDVRMYQQMQFFAVVFISLYLRALRDGRRRDIVLSAVCLLAMYLSHEESFVLLPAVPLAALVAYRTVWSHRRIFAAALAPAALVIAGQYLLAHIHPVSFGDDLSNRPYVGWDPHQADFYYQRIFFGPLNQASMAVLSTLALIGIVVSVRRAERAPALLGLALCTTVLCTSLVFTAKVERYSFVTVPMLVALATIGGAALVVMATNLCMGQRGSFADDGVITRPVWIRVTVAVTATVLSLGTVATLVTSPRGFGLLAADVTSAPDPLTHPDYRPTIAYLRSHLQPGDQVITLSPPVMTELYLGRRPDGVIQTGRNKLLYLVLRHGRAVETVLGVPVLLTGRQLRTYLEAHRRVWLVSDTGSYVQGVPPDVQEEVRADFTLVAQDAGTTLSLWNGG